MNAFISTKPKTPKLLTTPSQKQSTFLIPKKFISVLKHSKIKTATSNYKTQFPFSNSK